jgi:hypothetical protein
MSPPNPAVFLQLRPAPGGVGEDVLDFFKELVLVPDYAVPRLILPDLAPAAKAALELVGSERLPRVSQLAQFESRPWLDDQMDMVIHDHPRVEVITLSVEVMQR